MSPFTRFFASNQVHIEPERTRAAAQCIGSASKRFLLAVIAFSLTAALSVPVAHAYRTAGELDKFDGTKRVRCRSDRVSFVLNLQGAPSSIEGGAADVMLEAMRQWNEPICSSLEFQPAVLA